MDHFARQASRAGEIAAHFQRMYLSQWAGYPERYVLGFDGSASRDGVVLVAGSINDASYGRHIWFDEVHRWFRSPPREALTIAGYRRPAKKLDPPARPLDVISRHHAVFVPGPPAMPKRNWQPARTPLDELFQAAFAPTPIGRQRRTR